MHCDLTLKLCLSCYFDDFIQIDRPGSMLSAWLARESLLLNLGIAYATDVKKRQASSNKFGMLGLVLDLTGCPESKVGVLNTDARKGEIDKTIQEALAAGKLKPTAATSLAGRRQYAEQQIYGVTAGQVLRVMRVRGLSATRFSGQETSFTRPCRG